MVKVQRLFAKTNLKIPVYWTDKQRTLVPLSPSHARIESPPRASLLGAGSLLYDRHSEILYLEWLTGQQHLRIIWKECAGKYQGQGRPSNAASAGWRICQTRHYVLRRPSAKRLSSTGINPSGLSLHLPWRQHQDTNAVDFQCSNAGVLHKQTVQPLART